MKELFGSYAQNHEDVLIWHALKNVANGFYIDVGANDPITDSVTQSFYERGWEGINIEPVDFYFRKLTTARPRDITLQCATSDQGGSMRFHEIEGPGLSTLEEAVAQAHRKSGFAVISYTVESTPLHQICAQHATGPIHFLKVDVEGSEESVLRGMDFVKYRPWIVLVEAVDPTHGAHAHTKWEHLLNQNGYNLVWFDGVNRFYVSTEKLDELAPHFTCPPNALDCFESFSAAQLREAKNQQAKFEKQLNAAQIQIHHLREAVAAAKDQTKNLRHLLNRHSINPGRALRLWWNRKAILREFKDPSLDT